MKTAKQMIFTTLAFAVLTVNIQAASINQWKLTEVETNGYTFELGPYVGNYAYQNLYLPWLEMELYDPITNPKGIIVTWGYTSCPDPCPVIAQRLTNPPVVIPVDPGGGGGTGGSGDPGGSGGVPNSGVPEPGTWATVTGGVMVMLSRVRRQRAP